MKRNLGLRGRATGFVLTFSGLLLMSVNVSQVSALAAGPAPGACPASAPATGNNCYFIAATGADTNSGNSESSPWLHAPGMPKCANNCAAVTPAAGMGFIFRGGDTWHFGNSNATPYTGGGWNINSTWGTDSSCIYEGTQTGCIYYGVDQTWYSGSSWVRPILSGDNPASTSAVSSCAYQVAGSFWSNNTLILLGVATILDNFELTGMCSNTSTVTPGVGNVYIGYGGSGTNGDGMATVSNVYLHGWTATSSAGSGNSIGAGTFIGGTLNGLQTLDHIVIDGSDSNPSSWMWGQYPSFYHFRDSIVRYTSDGVGQWCHDIHDNIFEYIVPLQGGGHTNILECNADATGNPVHLPQNTPNVVYNNIIRHSNSNVMLWFCPNTIPEYYFNNIIYDSEGEGWSIVGPPTYTSCTNTGGQFMFNNTFVDGTSGGNWQHPCHLTGSNNTGGIYLTVYNEHLINTAWDGTGCTGGAASATNISMSDATATTQGYTTGSSGTYTTNTCAGDSTKPCSPAAPSNPTVNAGANLNSYCDTLASYSTESAIGTDAANACRKTTVDGCSYNATSHTMVCPAQTAVARPSAWDVGAYQFSSVQSQAPQPPTNLLATVH